ncbi:hypothetical protein AWC38_SpisGene10525 [Stylophora pistillata]|uniref:Uncharacterized protein n=1 Tax=Stylophora pistillata TaxID=50429 RepID=A0A2B4S8M6_STYPI|nr:hypothetical protein AWC38_SpisGene10525 [Stylophora pistillata]
MPKTHLTSAKASNFSPPDAYYPTDTGQSLAMALYDFYNFVVATEFCNLRHVSSVTCRMMSHVQYVYQSIAKRRFKCSRSLKGKEVATRAHNVLKDTCRSVAMCRSVQRLHKRRVETMRREANREGDVTNDSDADPDWSTQETDTFEDGEVPQAELGQQEDGESEEEGETSQKGAEPEKEPKTLACKTARRKRPCLVPGCKGFSRVNLKRHLTKVHYSKGELSKDDVERLFALSCAGSKKSGPIRQYAKKKSVPQGYENEEAFFSEPKPLTPRHRWLVAFYHHLATPAAGFDQEINCLQHAVQVRNLLEQLQPSGSDIQVLSQEDGCKVWLHWVVPNLTKKAAGTLKSYLNLLHMSLEFLTNKGKKPDLPVLTSQDSKILAELCTSLKGWRRTITKQKSSVRYAKILSKMESLMKTREVHAFMESEPSKEGQVALAAAKKSTSSHELSLSQYTVARDYLLVALTRTVGMRPGSLEMATLGQFRMAKWDQKERSKVMLVTGHKREVEGPAPIPMSEEMVEQLEAFTTKLRVLVTQDFSDSGKIFLKSDGAPYQKGTIGRRITAFVIKSGVRADWLISATDFRKWEDLTELAAEVSQQIQLHTTSTSMPKETEATLMESLPTSPYHARRSIHALTPEKTAAISVIFRDDLWERTSPWKKRVVSLIWSDETLSKIVHSGEKVKRVVDRVRYLGPISAACRPHQPPGG